MPLTTTPAPVVAEITCPRCDGVGEVYHGHRDPAMVVPVECFVCDGLGSTLPVVAAAYAEFLIDGQVL